MPLKSRLARLQNQAGVQEAVAARPAVAPLRERLSHLRPERLQGLPPSTGQSMSVQELSAALKGKIIHEGLLKIEEELSLTDQLGPWQGEDTHQPALLPGENSQQPALYIDTETTGLSGGSGTLAFLVGIAEIHRDKIRLSQYLITSFAAETAMLGEVLNSLPEGHKLVSYNGKSYDLPLLLTRLRMQGLTAPLGQYPHLDLLHPVRRLFQKRWPDCRLTTAEQQLLGLTRQDDLPGAEAPEAWFAYMQRRQGGKLVRVVQHNRQDILSLVGLHHALGAVIQKPQQAGIDFNGLGRWLMDNDEPRALALLAAHQDHLCDDSKRLLGSLLRRAEQWSDALPLWQELADKGCVESTERLAKYHEHVSKDLISALHYCRRLPGSSLDRHRLRRIEEKMGKSRDGWLL